MKKTVVPQIIDLQIIESQNIDAEIIEFDYIEYPKLSNTPNYRLTLMIKKLTQIIEYPKTPNFFINHNKYLTYKLIFGYYNFLWSGSK